MQDSKLKKRCLEHFARFDVLSVMLLQMPAFWDVKLHLMLHSFYAILIINTRGYLTT